MSFSFPVDSTARLDVFLSQQTGQSRQFVQEQIRAGRVLRNGSPITKASQKLKTGDVISGAFVETPMTDLAPVAYPLAVVYEDDALLVINKPQGMVVHPAPGHRGPTLVHHLLHHLKTAAGFSTLSPTRPGIVHRLDRGTSGLIIVAKHRQVQETLMRGFKARQIKKEYEAITWGRLQGAGVYKSVMGRDRKDRKKMSSKTDKGREAITGWESAETFAHFTHVRLFPQTGRTHQLRVHLTEHGHPIVGDGVYGRRRNIPALSPELARAAGETPQTFLHAKKLTFPHPIGGHNLELEAERPENFEGFLSLLRRED